MSRWHGARWAEMPSPGVVVAMHGTAPDALVAVGEAGLVARWDGARWHAVDAGSAVTLSGVHLAPSGEIMACGKGTVLLRGSGDRWEQVLARRELTGCVARWGDAWWVGAGGALGLCRLQGDQLVSVKPNLPATSFDARGDLLLSCPGWVVSTADGARFRGARADTFLGMMADDPPMWAR